LGITERRERERKEVREKILDAARELFVAEGYEAVTMRKVAEKIEYSPTAIYFHFRDKEALMRELCDADFAALSAEFQKIGRIPDPIERLRRIGRAYVGFAVAFPNHYRLMFMTPHPVAKCSDERQAIRGNPEQDAYAFLKVTVEESIATGRLKPEFTDPELVSQIVWSGVHGVVSLQIAKRDDDWVAWRDVKMTAHQLIEVMISGLVRSRS